MGLDVGVVQIDYSQSRPSGVAYKYAWELMAYDDGDCWKVSSGGQVFIELGYETMANHAMEFIESKGLTSPEAHQVMRWVRGLPWRGGAVLQCFIWGGDTIPPNSRRGPIKRLVRHPSWSLDIVLDVDAVILGYSVSSSNAH